MPSYFFWCLCPKRASAYALPCLSPAGDEPKRYDWASRIEAMEHSEGADNARTSEASNTASGPPPGLGEQNQASAENPRTLSAQPNPFWSERQQEEFV